MTAILRTTAAGRHRARPSVARGIVRMASGLLTQGRMVVGLILLVAVGSVAAESLASGRIGAEAEAYAPLVADTGPLAAGVDPSAAAAGLAPADQDPVAIQPQTAAAGVVPAHISIPVIGVEADLVDLVRDADGVLIPPDELLAAGWYSGSVVPGDIGPSVIAGHVDDTETAGVFARLRDLKSGDLIEARLSDGSLVTFSVDRTEDVAKSAFPTDEVYGATPTPQLRLITCNGPYDFGIHHYSNNLVVFASMVDPNLTVG